jgi:exonuclease III
VYGAVDEDVKHDFLNELHGSMINEKIPVLFCGDFNLVRYQEDKTNGVTKLMNG